MVESRGRPNWNVEYAPYERIQVRAFKPGFALLPHHEVEAIETWLPALFIRWDGEHPIIQWPDGQFQKLLSRKEIRRYG